MTWHRVHTALFEQRLTQEAVSIAKTYPSSVRAAYEAAAKSLRLPVFDYGGTYAATNGFYPILIDEQVTLHVAPSGATNVQVKNPFASYKFPITTGFDLTSQGMTAATPPGERCPMISAKGEYSVRYPSEGNYLKADIEAAQDSLKFIAKTCTQPLLYEFFHTNFPSYNCISNEYDFESGCDGTLSKSLERIHGFGHNSMGGSILTGYTHGGGTLSQVGPLQAFDPIFFFLHASMDKWLSMWQGINPDKWIEESTDIFGTYTAPPYEKTNEGTPLTPFWKDKAQGTYISSADVRDFKHLGYTYPDLEGNPSKAEIMQKVEALYGNFAQDSSACPYQGSLINDECQTCSENSVTGCTGHGR